MPTTRGGALNILHVLRAPVGGLFRHVIDLAHAQNQRGHRVGIVADATTGGDHAINTLADMSKILTLGVSRLPMGRQLGFSDFAAIKRVGKRAADVDADVVHGHGAKGGAYARLANAGHAIRVYTPHGGSLHYGWASPLGILYLGAERVLKYRTDLFLFESEYGRNAFHEKLGTPRALTKVVHNGVTAAEFAPVLPQPSATDVVFVGELRLLKGADILISALALLASRGRRVSATIVGDGPDREKFQAQVKGAGLTETVSFPGALPARTAFARGRLLVLPSRAESLPYVALEAAAAGLPVIATRVGGMAEIFGPDADALVTPEDPVALAAAIENALDRPAEVRAFTARLTARVRALFSVETMAASVIAGYQEALAVEHG